MVALNALIRDLPLAPDPTVTQATMEITGVSHDSRRVMPGDLFVAMAGAHHDARRFAGDAVGRGAVAVLGEGRPPEEIRVPWLQALVDPRTLLGPVAARIYDHPHENLTLVGITGTNGKSTVTALIATVLEAAGKPAGTLGTLGYRFRDLSFPGDRTTPEASDFFRMLRHMKDAGAESVAMEVSSHALSLGRVEGASFDAAVFTNLTRDHLDYHGDMESYFAAKRHLFDQLKAGGRAVVHLDDPYGRRLAEELPDALTYSAAGNPEAAVRLEDLELTFTGTRGRVVGPGGSYPFESGLLGRFNAENLAATAATATALELPTTAVQEAFAATRPVPGRLEPVGPVVGPGSRRETAQETAQESAPVALVDYAHTPSALEAALKTVRELAQGRSQPAQRPEVIVVFGCGGDRDTGKRGPMGRIAGELADLPILTSDNPRGEDPAAIIQAVEEGLKASGNPRYRVIPDRREAIRRAVAVAPADSVVLVAGKGHEEVQILRDHTLPFSDRQQILEALEVRFGREARR